MSLQRPRGVQSAGRRNLQTIYGVYSHLSIDDAQKTLQESLMLRHDH